MEMKFESVKKDVLMQIFFLKIKSGNLRVVGSGKLTGKEKNTDTTINKVVQIVSLSLLCSKSKGNDFRSHFHFHFVSRSLWWESEDRGSTKDEVNPCCNRFLSSSQFSCCLLFSLLKVLPKSFVIVSSGNKDCTLNCCTSSLEIKWECNYKVQIKHSSIGVSQRVWL